MVVRAEELVRTQKIISLLESGKIQMISVDGDDSLLEDLPTIKKSQYSTVPIGRSYEANLARIASELPEMWPSFWTSIGEIRGNPDGGNGSPGRIVPPYNFRANSTDRIELRVVFSNDDGAPAMFSRQIVYQNAPGEQENRAQQKAPIMKQSSSSNLEIRVQGERTQVRINSE